jgi:[calcium/calmodulin-dependent protein kinase] kinase
MTYLLHLCMHLLLSSLPFSSNAVTYAMKVLDKKRLLKKRLGPQGKNNALMLVKTEIAVWKKLIHPNCLCLFEVIEDQHYLFMISEYVDGGSVMDDELTGEPLELEDCRKIFGQLINGLEYLHYNNITHRDIKPGNILITSDGVVKIADFGMAYIFENGEDGSTATAGTAAFMPPEMTSGGEFKVKHADIWASGITLYMLLFGTVPFMARSLPELYEMIQTKPLQFPDDVFVDFTVKKLLTKMLDKDPTKRLTLEQIQDSTFLEPLNKERRATYRKHRYHYL